VARLLAVAVLALVLVAAGCAGDDSDTSATTEWASDFCSATLAWSDELERIGEEVSDLTSLTSDSIRQAADEAREATDTYVGELRDLGGPDTESGDAIESSLETLADEVEAESAEIEDAIEDMTGLAGATTAAREVASSAAAMFSALGATLDEIAEADAGGEIETAFDEAEACDEIQS
jgi:ABC-type transporter Mla subunit MlaD